MLVKKLFATLIAAGVFCALPSMGQAAIVVGFDPDGGAGGSGTQFTSFFDWQPNSALSDGGVSAVTNFVLGAGPTTLDTYAHARLGSIVPGIAPVPGTEITFVLGFREVVTSVSLAPGVANTATFDLVKGSGPNFFEMYFDATPDADALAGTGYNDGTLIMSAMITDAVTAFTRILALPITDLDQAAGSSGGAVDDYPLINSVQGVGATSLTASVTSIDPTFFTSFPAAAGEMRITLFNTSQVLPFLQEDPSAAFVKAAGGAAAVTDGAGAGGGTGLGSIGPINGISGPDIQFQQDANQSFSTAAVVPEPASLAIWGLALLTAGGVRGVRRRRNG